jgi:hypothetical protein
MESLVFVVLLSVVVITGMGQGSQGWVFVRKVSSGGARTYGEQLLAHIPWCAPCSACISGFHGRDRALRLPSDRKIDSGRGRPLLYLN